MKSLRSFPKLISAVLLVCAASLAWSCSDDDTGDDAFIPTFTLPEQPVIKNNYASQNNTITVVASPRCSSRGSTSGLREPNRKPR